MIRYNLMLVDDHPIIIDGLTKLVNATDNMEIVATATSGQEALNILAQRCRDIDLIIFDFSMPVMRGDEFFDRLMKSHYKGRTLLLTTVVDINLFTSMWNNGLDGILLKTASVDEILSTAKFLINNPDSKVWHRDLPQPKISKSPLSDREKFIMMRIAQGKYISDISDELSLSERTIKYHLTSAYNKIGATNRAQAVALAIKHKWIEF